MQGRLLTNAALAMWASMGFAAVSAAQQFSQHEFQDEQIQCPAGCGGYKFCKCKQSQGSSAYYTLWLQHENTQNGSRNYHILMERIGSMDQCLDYLARNPACG